MDLPLAVLADPECALGPRESRVASAAARGGNRGEHAAGFRIDLLNAIVGELKQVPAVERRAGMRGDIDRAQRVSACRIEGVQSVSSRIPHVLTVERDATDVVDTRKGSVFADDFRCGSTHENILTERCM